MSNEQWANKLARSLLEIIETKGEVSAGLIPTSTSKSFRAAINLLLEQHLIVKVRYSDGREYWRPSSVLEKIVAAI